jgi:hypothetical protein
MGRRPLDTVNEYLTSLKTNQVKLFAKRPNHIGEILLETVSKGTERFRNELKIPLKDTLKHAISCADCFC